MAAAVRSLLLAWMLLVLVPAVAGAHTKLVSSVPADGAKVDAAPASVLLTYSTEIGGRLQAVEVLTAGGKDLAGKPRSSGRKVTVPLRAGARGVTRVNWRVLGPDGHPIKGTLSFTVTPPVEAAEDEEPATTPAPDSQPPGADGDAAAATEPAEVNSYPVGLLDAIGSVARLAFYLALLIAAGGGIFASAVARRWRPRVFRAACAVVIGSALVMFLTNLAVAGEYSVLQLLNPWNLVPHVATPVGRVTIGAALVAAWLLLVGYRLLRSGGDRDRQFVLGMSLLLAALPAFGGHAIASQLPWLRVPADIIHLVAASVWFGGIVQLQSVASLSYVAHPAVYPTARRYAQLAFISVIALVVTGTIAALLEIGLDLGNLFGSTYGRLVLGKVALLALTIPLAKANQDRNVPALIEGTRRTTLNLRRYVVFEIVLVALIIAVTSWLVYETPPRHADMGHDIQAAAS